MDNEGEEDCIMMMWPVTIIHPIDEERSVISRIFQVIFCTVLTRIFFTSKTIEKKIHNSTF